MKLIGNTKEIINDEFIAKCTEYAKHFNPRDRTFADVVNHTIGGEAVEILVCKYLGLTQTDFSTMEYDATDSAGKKYEIKHTVKNAKWWNYNPLSYKFFLENSSKLDYIILCYYDRTSGNVYLKFKAHAPTFVKYSAKSKFNDMSYYNVEVAAKQKLCAKY